MNEEEAIHKNPEVTLEFHLKYDKKVSPADLLSLFQCATDFSKYITEAESLALLEHLGLPAKKNERLKILQRFHRARSWVPLTAEVKSIERGSWTAVVVISLPVILGVLKYYIHPPINEAWNESELRKSLFVFARDKAFGGSAKATLEKAIQTPQFGSLRISGVDTESFDAGEHRIRITLGKKRVEVDIPTSVDVVVEGFFER